MSFSFQSGHFFFGSWICSSRFCHGVMRVVDFGSHTVVDCFIRVTMQFQDLWDRFFEVITLVLFVCWVHHSVGSIHVTHLQQDSSSVHLNKILVGVLWISSWWFLVSTHLKNISQNGNLPQIGVNIKNMWNRHPDINYSKPTRSDWRVLGIDKFIRPYLQD